MMRKSFLLMAAVLALSGRLDAGGVLEMSAKHPEGPALVTNRIYSQGGMLRFDHLGTDGGVITTMIFRDNEMIIVSHSEKKIHRINEAMMAELEEKMAKGRAAMEKMQQQMANMPPQQRAMMEKMMKGGMPGMPSKAALPPLRLEASGTGSWQSYSCKNYTVYKGDEKDQEVCAAPPSQVKGASEFVQAARNMQEFYRKFQESLQMPGIASMTKNPVEVMGQIDGVPVYTKVFANGVLQEERFLSSAKEEGLADSTFAPPRGANR